MEFGIKERLILNASLQGVKGNVAQLRILRKLREELSFSEEEFKKFELRQEGGNFIWSRTKEESKEIEIGDEARKIIIERLKQLSAQGQLLDDHLDVIDKFPEVEEAKDAQRPNS